MELSLLALIPEPLVPLILPTTVSKDASALSLICADLTSSTSIATIIAAQHQALVRALALKPLVLLLPAQLIACGMDGLTGDHVTPLAVEVTKPELVPTSLPKMVEPLVLEPTLNTNPVHPLLALLIAHGMLGVIGNLAVLLATTDQTLDLNPASEPKTPHNTEVLLVLEPMLSLAHVTISLALPIVHGILGDNGPPA